MKSRLLAQAEPKPKMPAWLSLLLTPVMFCLMLGVFLVIVPIGLLLGAMLRW